MENVDLYHNDEIGLEEDVEDKDFLLEDFEEPDPEEDDEIIEDVFEDIDYF